MRKVGILGGTFNPIHNGHLALAMAAMEQYGLEEVWLMPSRLPPHKSRFAMLSENDRFALTALAAKENKCFIASDFELKREGLTYTVDTLELLTREYPEVRFYFIIGGDSLMDFLKWRRPERILELCTLLAAGRAGFDEKRIEGAAENLRKHFPQADLRTVMLSDYPISSREIREAFYAGEAERVETFLPAEVSAYLKEHHFFEKVTFEELDAEMQRILPRKRYLHSVAVAHLAAAYAASLGYNPERALIAGILHDCAKAYTDEQLVAACEKESIPITEVERRNGFLLHGKLGACYAETRYFITDPEILSAISYHTTGRSGMTDLEKIIFLADYLEPFRTQPTSPCLNKIRQTAFRDIEKAVYLALKNTIRYLTESGQEMDMTMTEAFKEYRQKYEKQTE